MNDATPKINCAKAELKAKCSSPPDTRSSGLTATCNVAIPAPITKREPSATEYEGKSAKLSEPIEAARKAVIITGFSEYFSTQKPAGIDMTPYAIKKKKPRNAA